MRFETFGTKATCLSNGQPKAKPADRVLVLTMYGELPGRVRSVEGRDLYAVRIGFPGLPD